MMSLQWQAFKLTVQVEQPPAEQYEQCVEEVMKDGSIRRAPRFQQQQGLQAAQARAAGDESALEPQGHAAQAWEGLPCATAC